MPGASPTIAQALALLDTTLRLASPDASGSLPAREFSGAELWHPHTDAALVRGKLLLVPGTVDEDARHELERALDEHGAAAILLPGPANEALRAHGEAIVSHALLVDASADWLDTAAALRALCTEELARETAGLRKGDLFSLAQAFATLGEGAVSIVDTAGRIVGYSTLPSQAIDEMHRQSTLTLQEQESPRFDAEYRRLAKSSTALWFEGSGSNYSRAALPVRAQGELLGSVWLIVTDSAEAQKALEFLDSVAGLAAHHMLEARELASAESQRDADLLRTLLDDEAYRSVAFAELGMREGRGYRTVAFSVFGGDDADEANPILHAWRHLHHVSLTARSVFGWCRAAIVGDQIVCVIPDASDAVVESFALRVLESTRVEARAGIGGSGSGAGEVAASLREALAVVALLRTSHRTRLRVAALPAVQELFGLTRLIDHLDATQATTGDPVQHMRAYDAAHDTELTRTVSVYLDQLANVNRTAAELHLHTNTVRYRLDRVKQQLGIDLDVPHVRLWVWLRLFASAAHGDP